MDKNKKSKTIITFFLKKKNLILLLSKAFLIFTNQLGYIVKFFILYYMFYSWL